MSGSHFLANTAIQLHCHRARQKECDDTGHGFVWTGKAAWDDKGWLHGQVDIATVLAALRAACNAIEDSGPDDAWIEVDIYGPTITRANPRSKTNNEPWKHTQPQSKPYLTRM